jgi:hypothetical protein
VDPVMQTERAVLDPQRWNRYGYVANSPTQYVDPDGRDLLKVLQLMVKTDIGKQVLRNLGMKALSNLLLGGEGEGGRPGKSQPDRIIIAPAQVAMADPTCTFDLQNDGPRDLIIILEPDGSPFPLPPGGIVQVRLYGSEMPVVVRYATGENGQSYASFWSDKGDYELFYEGTSLTELI